MASALFSKTVSLARVFSFKKSNLKTASARKRRVV